MVFLLRLITVIDLKALSPQLTKHLIIILTERPKKLGNGLAEKMINLPDIHIVTSIKPFI